MKEKALGYTDEREAREKQILLHNKIIQLF